MSPLSREERGGETNVEFGHEVLGDEDGGHLGLVGGVLERVLAERGCRA